MNYKELIEKLKDENERLKYEIKKLKSKVRTYERAFRETEDFLKDYTSRFSLDEILKAVENEQTMEESLGKEEVKRRFSGIEYKIEID